MLFFNALGLVLLPLASARPHAESTPYTTGSALEARKVLSEADVDSQFNFVPWEFRNICLDCARNSTDVQYSCKTKCELYQEAIGEVTLTVHKVDWSDPNSVPENNVTSGTCNSGAWEWDGTAVSAGGKVSYPSANTVCYSQGPLNYLQFRFVGFSNAENFTVEIVHRYMDDQ